MIVGVAPAAGSATRLQPLDGSKEMVRIGGRPVIDFLVERMSAGGAEEIRVVTRSDKHDVADHARSLGARVVLGEPANVAESLALGAEDLGPDDLVLFGFPDTLWEPVDGFARMVGELGDADAVLGLFTTPDLERSDVVVLAEGGAVESIAVKPAEPPSDLIWGCAAIRRRALDGLERHSEPGHLLDELSRTGRVRGVRLSDSWIDIGTPEALRRARSR